MTGILPRKFHRSHSTIARMLAVANWRPPPGIRSSLHIMQGRRVYAVLTCGDTVRTVLIQKRCPGCVGMQLDSESMDLLIQADWQPSLEKSVLDLAGDEFEAGVADVGN